MGELGSGTRKNSETESTGIKVYLKNYKCYGNMTLICFKEAIDDISDLGEISGVENECGIKTDNIDSNSTKRGTKHISNSESCNISGEEKCK